LGPPGREDDARGANCLHSSFSSAVTSGKKDLQEVIEMAKTNRENGKQTILFLDEIHRWTAQQDAPFVESGV
jgi:putative ATPase